MWQKNFLTSLHLDRNVCGKRRRSERNIGKSDVYLNGVLEQDL